MYEYNCKIVRVVDGDTVDVDIDLGFEPLEFMVSVSVFLAWIAPSVVAETPKEKAAGLAAKDFIEEHCYTIGGTYTLTTKEKGKFGRYLGVIMLSDKTSINAALVSEHLAVPYMGQSKQDIDDAHAANYDILKEKGLV
jgi:micrococcal nuclease